MIATRNSLRILKCFTGRTIPTAARPQRRHLSLHEYQSMKLLKNAGVTVPTGEEADSAGKVREIAERIGGAGVVVKAQVLAGGRGKGRFESGLKGGVHLTSTAQEAEEIARKMIGSNLITIQTGSSGRPCNKVLVCERLNPVKEYYMAIVMDRSYKGPVIMASSEGGINIEDVARNSPDAIVWEPVDIMNGMHKEKALGVVKRVGFSPECQQMASEQLVKLYEVFLANDATTLEINPMTEDANGKVYCMDAKINIDDNASYRQKELFNQQDKSQEEPDEIEATEWHLNYIKLDGSIGCVVNGAGLAMATMDVIKLHNGKPANFLDIGGGASEEQVTKAFQIISRDKNVKVILVNIFGGIIRCDRIAKGIITALKKIDTALPIVVRLKGNSVDEAKALFAESDIADRITSEEDFGTAAKHAVKLASPASH